jgi:putative oxidoreductase
MTAYLNAASVVLVGRLLLGGLFVIGGITHLFVLPGAAGQLRQRGVPFPMLTLIAGTVFETVAGAAVMIDFFVPFAAGGLILFTVASSCMMMNFWAMTGEKRISAIDGWTSNLGVIGGLLIVAALG